MFLAFRAQVTRRCWCLLYSSQRTGLVWNYEMRQAHCANAVIALLPFLAGSYSGDKKPVPSRNNVTTALSMHNVGFLSLPLPLPPSPARPFSGLDKSSARFKW